MKFDIVYPRAPGSTGHSIYGVGLRSLACWDCGFESRRLHGCFSVVGVVCCQVEVSATSWFTRLDESYRVWRVDVCDLQNLNEWGCHGLHWVARPQEQEYPPVKAILIIVCNPFYPFCVCLSFNVNRDGMNSVLKFLCSLLFTKIKDQLAETQRLQSGNFLFVHISRSNLISIIRQVS